MPYKVKLTAAIVSILVTISALALLIWKDFGYIQLEDQTWALSLVFLAGTKVAISAAPHWTRCAYDMIFEHLYVEYLYLKHPIARPEKKSNKAEGKKEGKPKSPMQETDLIDLILQSNA
jgi:hypothetical protein